MHERFAMKCMAEFSFPPKPGRALVEQGRARSLLCTLRIDWELHSEQSAEPAGEPHCGARCCPAVSLTAARHWLSCFIKFKGCMQLHAPAHRCMHTRRRRNAQARTAERERAALGCILITCVLAREEKARLKKWPQAAGQTCMALLQKRFLATVAFLETMKKN